MNEGSKLARMRLGQSRLNKGSAPGATLEGDDHLTPLMQAIGVEDGPPSTILFAGLSGDGVFLAYLFGESL
ncbi:MAG: hypothetical protein AAF366_10460 [Pseudomonadota bacterium]